MKKSLQTAAFIFLCFVSFTYAQSNEPHWKPLVINESKRIWYDGSSIDALNGNIINVWVLEMMRPPLTFDQIPGRIYRSKTLYSIDLNRATYGIMKVAYYNLDNKEIYSHDYKIEDYPDSVKYSYPILENSTLHLLLKDLYKVKNKTSN
ncbi:MAG: hypothetical protein ACYCVH_00110 [Ignavibacteriaceae bacterium]